MRFPDVVTRLVGSKGRSPVIAGRSQDVAEKVLVEALRTLSHVCVKVADVLEAQRLNRAGFEEQGKFLERLDGKTPEKKPADGP